MAQKLSKKDFNKKVAAMREENERLKILHEIREERELYSPKARKKQTKSTTRFVIASIVAIVMYTCVALVIQACTGTEVSTTLTEHWYAFWTIEIAALTGIKITNVIKEHNSKDTNDEENDSNAAG